MKKTEMIEYILDRICGSYELNDGKVREILDICEEAGMTPPLRIEPNVVKEWEMHNGFPEGGFYKDRKVKRHLRSWERE